MKLGSRGWNLESSYTALPEALFSFVQPRRPRAPELVFFNHDLCQRIELESSALAGPEGSELLSGYRLPPGSKPYAQAYAGHQFGHFAILGDGRALTLGEQVTSSGKRFDIQLKGSGKTPYSRGADGLAALGPMLREALISEAMHGLGIPTTRSLAVVATGDLIQRNALLPGAVLTRVASSHLRVGTFEYAAATGEPKLLSELVRYALERHFTHAMREPNRDTAHPARILLQSVAERQADLVARWQAAGFVHGVMNTDNMTISGETIDYGPCAFLDGHDPQTVFSSIDQRGRYAFGQQPLIMLWNLERLAAALLPMLEPSSPEKAKAIAREILESAVAHYGSRWQVIMGAKLGIGEPETVPTCGGAGNNDAQLLSDLLGLMARYKADHTNTFLRLTEEFQQRFAAQSPFETTETESAVEYDRAVSTHNAGLEALFRDEDFGSWKSRWIQRLQNSSLSPSAIVDLLRASNPRVIPRNHAVESVLQSAVDGDFKPFARAVKI
ncbi:MAG: protein adenylyltransferase SelO, partial [Burkholderiaceae bacterium]